MLSWNVDKQIPTYADQKPRRAKRSSTPQGKSENSQKISNFLTYLKFYDNDWTLRNFSRAYIQLAKNETSCIFKYICDTQYIIQPQEFQHS